MPDDTKGREDGHVHLAFGSDLLTVPVTSIVPLKTLPEGARASRSYAQVLSSIRAIGLYSWFSSGSVVLESMSPRTMNFHRISYNGLNLFKTPEVVQALAWVAIACAVLGWGAILWNWIETRKRPSISALIGYTTMYTLLAFVRIHPLFAYASPMFHSLQYMLFVYAYKRGEFSTELAEHHHEDKKLDRPIWYRHLSYFLLMCATGALAFDILPVYFEAKSLQWGWQLMATPIFHVFVNTHHYFIDTAIWRRDNRNVSKFLFARPKG
jgi:hypothetical protein